MPVTVRQGVLTDAPAISKVHYDALARYHPFYAAFFINHPRDILPQSTAEALQDPKTRFLMAVGDEDEVVGFVRYEVLREAEDEASNKSTASASLFSRKEYLEDLWEEFGTADAEKEVHYSKTFEGRNHYYIKHLMVSPSHQKQGIGATLLRLVLQQSDEAKVPTVLVSSAEGMALYRRLGFKELATWRVDNGTWAKRIVERMKEIGVEDEEGLVEMYRGVDEVETYMVRWVEGTEENKC